MHNSTERKKRNYAIFLVFVLTLCYSLVSFYRTSASTLAVAIMEDFAVGGGLMAIMSSAYFYPYGLMQIPAGILADRWGARKTISLFLIFGAIGATIFALANSVLVASLGRILIGAGMAMVFVPALRVLLHWFPPSSHAFVTGLLLSLGTIGMLVATYPLLILSEAVGWRNSMLLASFITFLCALFSWIYIRNTPEEKGFASHKKVSHNKLPPIPLKTAFKIITKSSTYWSVSIWFFCMFGSFYTITGLWAGAFFTQGYILDTESVGSVLLCLALGAVIGPSCIGFLLQWIHISKSLILTLSCFVTICLFIPMLSEDYKLTSNLLYIWALCFGVSCSGFGSVALTKIQEDFPSEIVGTATGMINIYSYIGTAILQMLSGFIMEKIAPLQTSYTFSQYGKMFYLFMFCFILAFISSLYCFYVEFKKNK